MVPDADFLSGGQYVLDAHGYYFDDSAKGARISPTGLIDAGIIEWVNLEIGYSGGLTCGFKARLLGENSGAMPSLAVGVHNIISNKEAHYFNSRDTTGGEFYFALAKSVEPLRMRVHCGMQSIPTSKKDQVNPFFALEEYFGNGLYGTAEVERRKGAFWPSLFVSWRLLKKKLEISGGAVAINRLFFDKNNKFSASLISSDTVAFVKPGLWLGIRYCGGFGFGKNTLFTSVDDKLSSEHESIEALRKEVDSLKTTISENQTRMAKVDNSLLMLSDSVYSDKTRFRAALLDKLIALKTLYESEPFDPEQARQSIRRMVALKESALPVLKEFIIDKKQDRKVRLLSISLLGEMQGSGASDALLDVLSQSEDPEIKIEILIALGKIKETRAIYVMEQLANDPIDVVAFTAQEVLMKLVREKGIQLSSDFKMRPVSMPEPSIMKEEKIPIRKAAQAAAPKTAETDRTPSSAAETDTAAATVKKDVWGVQGMDSTQAKPVSGQSKAAITAAPAAGPGRPMADAAVARDTSAAKNVLPAKTTVGAKKAKVPKKEKKPKQADTADQKNW